jgi:hypothetical protein
MRIDLSQITPLEFQFVAAPVFALVLAGLYVLGIRASRRTGIPPWKYVVSPSAASTMDRREKLIALAIMAGGLELMVLLLYFVQ